ncbi:MAG: glycosyltransferase family 4 protein [Candidatus Micrarchaeia archaeon]|jgi:glycosyltransferase involved in cell wall biosynthesis
MKIVMFSWKDLKHPESGGAEWVTDKYLSYLVEKGHEVELVCSGFKDSKKNDSRNGYKITRLGNRLTVYPKVFFYYKKHLKGKVDVVIDQINTIPFFTPLFVKEKKIGFIHQTAREVWFYEMPPLISHLGYFIEPLLFKPYKDIKMICVSESTAQDMKDFGVKETIVIHNGCDVEPLKKSVEKEENTFCFVGRLTSMKRVDHAILAIAELKKYFPDVKLKIIGGNGKENYVRKIKALVKEKSLEENVIFTGYLTFEKRNEEISKCNAIIVPSVREGWGLIVIEANALGTSAVGYDVQGLRDSIQDKVNGWLVKESKREAESIKRLSETLKIVLSLDNTQRSKINKRCIDYALEFKWEKSEKAFLGELIEK